MLCIPCSPFLVTSGMWVFLFFQVGLFFLSTFLLLIPSFVFLSIRSIPPNGSTFSVSRFLRARAPQVIPPWRQDTFSNLKPPVSPGSLIYGTGSSPSSPGGTHGPLCHRTRFPARSPGFPLLPRVPLNHSPWSYPLRALSSIFLYFPPFITHSGWQTRSFP